jgi:type IV pilus assembly protein PilA
VHAADLYLNYEKAVDKKSVSKIRYKELYDLNYLNEFSDPYTGNALPPSRLTYVEETDGEISRVCLDGDHRSLCAGIDHISVDQIVNK